jgi:hypothetical protein
MVSFLPLDITDDESIGSILSHIDHAIQYGEHEEPKEPQWAPLALWFFFLPQTDRILNDDNHNSDMDGGDFNAADE